MGNVDVPFAAIPPRGERSKLARVAAAEMPFVAADEAAPAVDVRAITSALHRHQVAMLLIVAAAVLAGVMLMLTMPRIYEARASVQIEQQTAKVLGTEDNEPIVSGSDADRFLQTQVDIITSRQMAIRVAQRLGLAASDDFLTRMNGGTAPAGGAIAGTRLQRVLDTLQKNLTADMRHNSRVVGILFRSRDPQLARDIANSYAKNFIQSNVDRRFSATAYSRGVLTDQLALAKRRLEESERSLIGYARSARLIDATAGGSSGAAGRQPETTAGPRSLVTANLVDMNAAFADSEAASLRARQHWEQARQTPLMSLPEVLSSDTIQRLTQKRAEEVASLSQLQLRLKPDHPLVVQAKSELAALDAEIQTMAASILDSIRTQYLTAERQHQALSRQLNSLKGATLSEQDRSVQYNILQREVDTNRQLYEGLLQRFKEVSAEAGIVTNNLSMVDEAEAPRRPVTPRSLLILLLSGIAGVGLALLYAFGREYLDDTLRDPREVEARLHLPLLGVVPERTDGAPLAALEDAKSDIAEAYQSIRTSIELSSNRGLPQTILVTGSGMSEGKSTSSFALARDFAMIGRRVLLVDADLRRPSLHLLTGGSAVDQGLSNVLARQTQAPDAIVDTIMPNLSFLPSGPIPPNPATLFAGTAFAELLASLGRSYDIVVIDGPPVLALADATQLGAAAQATIFVAEAGRARFGFARNAVSRLTRAGANVIGCVVTKYNAKKAGYGRSDDYYQYAYEGAR